ncbi:MAG TPA: dihydroneopterin aldolase [Planctomycetes bacterium]|nr:dihydroneopterin aldolase [Planctomycetota bacterium]HIN80098.1 dihydroneopterin aldolase [Planctomycetota bacterium]
MKPHRLEHLDKIDIHDLTVRTIIGIFDWERSRKQDVRLQIRIYTDISAAASSDNIEDAVDYKCLTKEVIGFVEEASFSLLEALAEEVSRIVLRKPGVEAVKVSAQKPGALRRARNVSVTILRPRIVES